MGRITDTLQGENVKPVEAKTGLSGFMQRLKLGFGGEKALQQQSQVEAAQGNAGRLDIGDVADVAGRALPFLGSVAGGILGAPAAGVGAVPGAALGAAAGAAAQRTVGRFLGVASDRSVAQDVGDIAKEGLFTYAGGKVLGAAAKLPVIKGAVKYAIETLPTRLYSTFFKTTADDMAALVRTGAIEQLQSTNPTLFKELIREGIIKTNATGAVEVNPTLAEEALARGLGSGKTGRSLENMGRYLVQRQMELELAARNVARNVKEMLPIENANGYIKMLTDTAEAFSKEGYGFLNRVATQATELAGKLESQAGTLAAEDTLKLRRLIDGLRNTASFRDSPTLSPKQAIFKEGADRLRGQLAKLPGMEVVMNEYRFAIEAADSIVKEAARRGNTRIFGLFDAILGGSSMGSGLPGMTGLGIMTAARTIQTPAILTAIARGLSNRLPSLTKTGLGSAIRYGVGQLGEKLTR